ncbi:hypothetical protein GAMM_130009 [Gammaproteobacteria bacterium]
MLEKLEMEQQREAEGIETVVIKSEKEKQKVCKDFQDKKGIKLVLIKCY